MSSIGFNFRLLGTPNFTDRQVGFLVRRLPRVPPMTACTIVRSALAVACWLPSAVLADSPDAVVTFNEIHYHPPGSQEAEWVELHNQMAVNIDLSGWSLANGIDYAFPRGTVLSGGGQLVIAKLPGHPSLAGVAGVLGPFTGNLANEGETIDLVNPSGRLMDRLSYGTHGDWPVTPDGAGATLAKRWSGSAAANPAAWRPALQAGGSPGARNFRYPNERINHVLVDAGASWRFSDLATAPAGDWTTTAFDDATWSQGQAPFGSAGAPAVLGATASLVERYRAGALTGLLDGAAFTSWPDTATGDGVAQHAVYGSDPRFESNATATGEPSVSFDGNDEFRTAVAPGIGATSGFVYFIVCKAGATQVSGGLADGNGAYLFDRVATVGSPLVSLKAVNGRYGFQKRYDDSSSLGGMVSTTPISTTRFQIVAVRRNPAASRFEIWVDGVMEAVTPDSGGNLTPQPIVIGRHAITTTSGFKGEIAELLVYRDTLTDLDFKTAGAYLEARYGLATAFPDSAARTPLAATASTAYFRKSFSYAGDPARTTLSLDRTLADGAVFYLNGQEIARGNLPGGAIGHATAALSDVVQAVPSGYLTVPSAALVRGTNVLVASVHTGAADNTAYFTAALRAEEIPVDPEQAPPLQLNEIAAATAAGFFIELRNPRPEAVSTSGFAIEVSGSLTAFVQLPEAAVPAGGVIHYTEEQLGFRPAAGDKVILRGPDGFPVDAQLADASPRGRTEVWPDRWLSVSSATPSVANLFELQRDIVINELCYNPPDVSPASADKQWLELYNRGATAVDLSGWSFASGISYGFPNDTHLAPGGYLVIAKNPGNFPTPPGATVLGPWAGSLASGGERVLLLDRVGNPASEVTYLDGGRWPGAADAAGSTLELRDPWADPALPESWAASEESARRSWQSYSYRATAAVSTGPDSQWREFILGLMDTGEVLIDDLTVIESPDTAPVSMIANGDFSSGTSGWRFLGNHRNARVIADPDQPGNNVLYLGATGPTEHMHNHVETTLANGKAVTNGRIYEVRYRARWLSGSNRLNTRLYFNRVAKTTELTRSDTPGTPGAANSTAVANLGPGFTAVEHSPVVPAADEPVVVTARAADPDGVATLTLGYAVESGGFSQIAMTRAADGATFTAVIPGLPAATVVRFYITATDAAAQPASASFPAGGADGHALYQVNDGLAATSGLHNLRIIMAPADEALLYQTNNLMSNGRLGCTVIYDESEIYYNVGVRLKSSQRGRVAAARVGFNLGFNKDQLFRGIHRAVAIDRSEGQITGCQEILYDQMMSASGGIPAEYNDLCQVLAPDPAHTSHAILQLARFGDVFLDSQFDHGSEGTSYEYELVYYPTTVDANGYKLPQPDSVTGVNLTSLGDDKESYRWNYLLENNEDRDDYSRVIAMTRHFDKSGADFETGLDAIIDIDQWLRALAYSCASGAGDSFFANANHNGIFHARPDGRMLYFPHDMDFSFSATRNIYESTELQRLTANPARNRAYLGHLHDICTTVFNQSYMSSWANHFGSLLPGEDFVGHLSYINTRSGYILNAINTAVAPVTFAITTNGGADFTTATSPVTLAGQGWVNVRAIRLIGSTVPLASTWTSANAWQVAVPLAAGPNAIVLEALDFSGAVVGTDRITVTNTGGIEQPLPGTLVISEIHYNPPGSIETTEYLELFNPSARTLDLSNVTFTAGPTFTFPTAFRLAPGARTLLVKDEAAFNAAFGAGLPVAGVFPDNLSNSGEWIELRRADNLVLLSFSYHDSAPWPTEADGGGYSLVLAAPASNPDPADPRSWRASAVAGGGSPGTTDTESYAAWKAANGDPGDTADSDGDGLTTRQEYFLGGDPAIANPNLATTLVVEPGGALLLSVTRRASAEGAAIEVQSSTDLTNWSTAPAAAYLGSQRLPGSPAIDRLTFRITPLGEASNGFTRFAFGP